MQRAMFYTISVLSMLMCLPICGWAQASKKKPPQATSTPLKSVPQSVKRLPMSAKEVFQKHHGLVFTVKTDKGLGTGFMFSGIQLMTCYHVIEDTSNIKAISSSG